MIYVLLNNINNGSFLSPNRRFDCGVFDRRLGLADGRLSPQILQLPMKGKNLSLMPRLELFQQIVKLLIGAGLISKPIFGEILKSHLDPVVDARKLRILPIPHVLEGLLDFTFPPSHPPVKLLTVEFVYFLLDAMGLYETE